MAVKDMVLNVNYGYSPDLSGGSMPNRLNGEDIGYIRSLAEKVNHIADKPKYREGKELWYRLNSLEKVRPLIVVHPEIAWLEIIKEEDLKITDPYWKQWEFYFLQLIYRDKYFDDDFVIEKHIDVPAQYTITEIVPDELKKIHPSPGHKYSPFLENKRDFNKLKIPRLSLDVKATSELISLFEELFEGILEINPFYYLPRRLNHPDMYVDFRGVMNFMIDMYDDPEWMHKVMRFITDAQIQLIKDVEETKLISPNNRNHITGGNVGGMNYCRELAGADKTENLSSFKDVWGTLQGQSSDQISPVMFKEFVFDYQKELGDYFGLNYYGCCEPLTERFKIIKALPRLRKVSVSPWCDIETAAQELEDKIVFSWKPDPRMLVKDFDTGALRKYFRETFSIASDCIMEITLNALMTLNNDPMRLGEWMNIAKEEAERFE